MNYQLYTKVNDGGQVVTKIIIECDSAVEGANISLSQFDVSVTRYCHKSNAVFGVATIDK